MTDYAQASTADPSWTWWMTTAVATVRLRNLQNSHQHRQGDGGGSGSSDADDEFAGPGGKRQRVGDVFSGGAAGKDEYWPFERNNGLLHLRHRLDEPEDATSAGPLDLSVKATLTTTTNNNNNNAGKRAGSDGYPAAAAAKTPEKRPAAAAATASRAGKSAKKTSAAAGTAASTTAVKAATRKLLPQLMLDRHVDRSSPVSGTIIVPAGPEEPMTAAAGRKRPASYSPSLSSSSSLPSPPPYSAPMTDCAATQDADDDYDGGDIDPEFNVVVATDEARRQIESIPNALGPYRCRLCGVRYVDAFALARHRCRCIVHVRYTCPECDKVFQCPANLASHRRWHGTGTAAAKTVGAGKVQHGKNGDNNNGGGGSKPVNVPFNVVGDIAATVSDVNDGDGANSITTAPMTSISGFKKNILQRAVQAAAAAAAAACNDNNNNDGGNDDNEKHKCNDDRGDIAK